MNCAKQQQDCPRHAGTLPQTGEPPVERRAARRRAGRAIDLDMPRVLSASTFALAVASAPPFGAARR